MRQAPLWKLAVTTSPEAEEALIEWLGRASGLPVSSYTDAETRLSTLTVFHRTPPAEMRPTRAELRNALLRIAACGLDTRPGTVSLRELHPKAWVDSWKRHFKPIQIGSALLVKPTWSRRDPRSGQAVVVLDPGLSFGTGQHPTTQFCLEQIVGTRRSGTRQSFFDVGTGSGILAIAAAALGYGPVSAIDNDPDAVRIARKNASQNGVARKIRFALGDITRRPRRVHPTYDLVCANLIANLLVAHRDSILSSLSLRGTLVLAGILELEFAGVRSAYEAAGLRLTAAKTSNEWRSGAFTRATL